MGDFSVDSMTFLPDPCPLPEGIKKRSLVEKDKSIYAPMSGVGGIVYDKDAVYISDLAPNTLTDVSTMFSKISLWFSYF